MQERKSFGKFIREKRKEQGYSQQQLAEKLFVSESAVSKWERGVNYPDITMISDICKVLEISEHELITASDDTEYRRMKRDANKFRRLTKAGFLFCVIAYAAALIICFICNLCVNHTLSWFWVVLGSLLCAFSFFPTYTRFFTENKFLWFLLTSALSVVLLLIICGIYTGSVLWVPVASAGVVLGYALLFMPVVFKKYSMPPAVKNADFLIYIVSLFALTALVLLSARILTPYPVSRALLLALYCYSPFILTGILSLFVKDKLILSGAGVLLAGGTVYALNAVIARLFGSNGQDFYTVNFSDWDSFANGNIFIIFLVVSLSVGAGLLLSGFVKKAKKRP